MTSNAESIGVRVRTLRNTASTTITTRPVDRRESQDAREPRQDSVLLSACTVCGVTPLRSMASAMKSLASRESSTGEMIQDGLNLE